MCACGARLVFEEEADAEAAVCRLCGVRYVKEGEKVEEDPGDPGQ